MNLDRYWIAQLFPRFARSQTKNKNAKIKTTITGTETFYQFFRLYKTNLCVLIHWRILNSVRLFLRFVREIGWEQASDRLRDKCEKKRDKMRKNEKKWEKMRKKKKTRKKWRKNAMTKNEMKKKNERSCRTEIVLCGPVSHSFSQFKCEIVNELNTNIDLCAHLWPNAHCFYFHQFCIDCMICKKSAWKLSFACRFTKEALVVHWKHSTWLNICSFHYDGSVRHRFNHETCSLLSHCEVCVCVWCRQVQVRFAIRFDAMRCDESALIIADQMAIKYRHCRRHRHWSNSFIEYVCCGWLVIVSVSTIAWHVALFMCAAPDDSYCIISLIN